MNPMKLLRMRAGLQQNDVARHFGISQVSVWQWEHGITYPRAPKIPELAKCYGCSVSELMKALTAVQGGRYERRNRSVPADAKRSSGAVQDQYKTVGQADSQ